MVVITGEEIRENDRSGRWEFLREADQELREELLRTDGNRRRNNGGIRQIRSDLLQDGEPGRNLHPFLRREEQGEGSDTTVPEHGETMPKAGLYLIRQAFQKEGTAARQAEAHLLRQEVVFSRISGDLQENQAGEHHEEAEMEQQQGTEAGRQPVYRLIEQRGQEESLAVRNKAVERKT